MKILIILTSTFVSIQVSACPIVSGTFHCPETALDHMMTRTIDIRMSQIPKAFRLGIGNMTSFHEVDSWNPDIDPRTGNANLDYVTQAKCSQASVSFQMASFPGFEETSSLEITPEKNGIDLTGFEDGQEVFSFFCEKIK